MLDNVYNTKNSFQPKRHVSKLSDVINEEQTSNILIGPLSKRDKLVSTTSYDRFPMPRFERTNSMHEISIFDMKQDDFDDNTFG